MIIKCKMCGGDIQFNPGDTNGQCDHCGCTTTFPKLPDEQRANLFNRANHFRRQCEFDKAMAAYEHILEEDDTDAEAHWGIVLSKFGIEYVEDPVTHERIPTCHRAQVISILSDEDYQNALKYAPDTYSRDIYEKEAKRIAEIQKGILAISSQEKPYDIFICYKESDDSGSRTKDSTLAQEIYYQLTNEGYKVFFSRITLEDKLGQEYEPYIFAALNSAKVMLVVGTKPEYFSAVWVKNEWSRYLALMTNDRKRVLIPCYRDMDPYDLPDDLSSLQSLDMGKIGFMQDLIRGIHKVLGEKQDKLKSKEPDARQFFMDGNSNANALLDRAFMALEDEEWGKAHAFCESALNINARNPKGYLGELLAEMKVSKVEELINQKVSLDQSKNYNKVLRFADEKLRATLEEYNRIINDRLKQNQIPEGTDAVIIESINISSDAMTVMFPKLEISYFNNSDKGIQQTRFYLKGQVQDVKCIEPVAPRHSYKGATFLPIVGTDSSQINKIEVEYEDGSLLHIPGDKVKIDPNIEVYYKLYCSANKRISKAKDEKELLEIRKALEETASYYDVSEQLKKCDDKINKIKEINELLNKISILEPLVKGKEDLAEKIKNLQERIDEYNDKILKNAELLESLNKLVSFREYRRLEEEITENKNKCDELQSELEKKRAEFDSVMQKTETYGQIEELIYITAGKYFLSEMYVPAIRLYNRIRDYKDVQKIINDNQPLADANIQEQLCEQLCEKMIERLKHKGNIVSFGRYCQSEKNDEASSIIKWEVLDVEKDRSLLISTKILDQKAFGTHSRWIFNPPCPWVTWNDSIVREWLNSSFLTEAFTEEEQEVILKTKVFNNCKVNYEHISAICSEPTEDKVFLLDMAEVQKYKPSNPTVTDKTQNSSEYSQYLLRTCIKKDDTYINQEHILLGGANGDIFYKPLISGATGSVRPALWVDTRKSSWDNIILLLQDGEKRNLFIAEIEDAFSEEGIYEK